MTRLVLASTSVHRRELLRRLRIPFDVVAPHVDETAKPDEQGRELAERLAHAKARAITETEAIVVGSDQVAALDGRVLRKPGGAAEAVTQLLDCQGRTVDFFTAAAVVDQVSEREYCTVDHTLVEFRVLEKPALSRYVQLDESWHCAGGFKSESLGCVLFRQITTHDPSALIGLPMIWLAGVLSDCGLDPLTEHSR